jgi:diacylglycerol O-acyltransferase
MSRERLSNIDTLMLRVDNPASPNMVIGLMVLAAPVPRERLQEVIRARILRFDRFRQRLVSSRLPLRAPRWEDVTDIDFEYHVKEVTLPPPGDQAAYQELISDRAMRSRMRHHLPHTPYPCRWRRSDARAAIHDR